MQNCKCQMAEIIDAQEQSGQFDLKPQPIDATGRVYGFRRVVLSAFLDRSDVVGWALHKCMRPGVKVLLCQLI